MDLRTVLCPIDFSDISQTELALGVEVCRTFGSRLVLHHNVSNEMSEFPPPANGQDGKPMEADERLRATLSQLPEDITAQASISTGPLTAVILDRARELPADLMILGSHGWSTRDHASVTEQVVERSPCPVLTLHDGVGTDGFHLRSGDVDILVPTDLTETGAHAMAYAFELARRIKMRVHVLHVAARGADATILDALREQLYGLIPSDLEAVAPLEAVEPAGQSPAPASRASTVECYIRRGDPIEEILLFGEHLDPTFLVMGEHAHTFFRRHFTRDSAVEVLHRAPWPVWFVPAH